MSGAKSVAAKRPWRGLGIAALAALWIHGCLLVWAHKRWIAWPPQTPTWVAQVRVVAPQTQMPLLPPQTQAPDRVTPKHEPTQTQAQAQAQASRPLTQKADAMGQVKPAVSVETSTPSEVSAIVPTQLVTPAFAPAQIAAHTPTLAVLQDKENLALATALPTQERHLSLQSRVYPPNTTVQFDGVFKSKGVAQSGRAVLTWASDGGSYELVLRVSAWSILSRVEKSVGSVSASGIAPRRYSSVRTGRSEQATHFRADLGRIQFSNNKPDEALHAGAQDALSVLIELAALVAGQAQGHGAADRFEMQVATLDGAQIWEFSKEAGTVMNLPTGALPVIELRRKHRHEYDRNLQVWLAPSLGYLPVRVLQSSRAAPQEDYADLTLSKLP